MSFSDYVQNILEDNHTVLTIVVPAGTTKNQIRQFVNEETQKLLNTENAKYEYVSILLALLLRVEKIFILIRAPPFIHLCIVLQD